MNSKVVVVGSANTDMVVRVPRLPNAGETVLGGAFLQARGGKGANQAVAAARLGADVTLIARLGRDVLGHEAAAAYQAEGIDTHYVVWDPEAPSGVALILVNPEGENVIAVAPGANQNLSPVDVAAAESAFAQADCVLMQLEIPLETVMAAAEMAQRYGARVILNPAPAAHLPPALLQFVDLLTPNRHEAALLAGLPDAHEERPDWSPLQGQLRRDALLVVTVGQRGAYLCAAGQRPVLFEGYAVTSIDATGAGDAFNAALAVALGRGWTPAEALRYANAAAAISVTRAGAQPSLATGAEVERLLFGA